MFEESDDLVVAALVRPVEAGLLLVLLLVAGQEGLTTPGQQVDVGPPLQQVVDEVQVSLVAGRVEGGVTVRALVVD